MSEEEQSELGTLQWFVENKMSFNTLMAQQPDARLRDQRLAAGLLAWNGQLLGEDLDPDFAISNVMLYWLTGTGTSAASVYTRTPTSPSGRRARRRFRSRSPVRWRLQRDPPVRRA